MSTTQGSKRDDQTSEQIRLFQEQVWHHGRTLYRSMPWRDNPDPYWVLVSELMLQQTQVERVVPKFTAFITTFPTLDALARAPLADVLVAWSGLGYNRRAKFVSEAAKKVMADYGGIVPSTLPELRSLPGVGPNTAGAILAYGFNQPSIFIETNIRTVYFHHFFEAHLQVHDQEVTRLVEQTLDRQQPRRWYWALMDYGSWLKKQGVGHNQQSRHYHAQSPLRGSVREIRGQILKALVGGPLTLRQLGEVVVVDARLGQAIEALRQEGLLVQTDTQLYLTK